VRLRLTSRSASWRACSSDMGFLTVGRIDGVYCTHLPVTGPQGEQP
jgi:hypothetical protein